MAEGLPVYPLELTMYPILPKWRPILQVTHLPPKKTRMSPENNNNMPSYQERKIAWETRWQKVLGVSNPKKQVSMTTIRNGAIPCSRIKMFAPSPEVFSAGKASTIAQRGNVMKNNMESIESIYNSKKHISVYIFSIPFCAWLIMKVYDCIYSRLNFSF